MSRNNQVTLIGNLTHDAEHTPAGEDTKARTLLKVATNDNYRQDGEWKSHTDFHRVVAFGKTAERLKDLEKGQGLVVQGKLQTRSYEKDDETRYITEVVTTWVQPTAKLPNAEPGEDEAE